MRGSKQFCVVGMADKATDALTEDVIRSLANVKKLSRIEKLEIRNYKFKEIANLKHMRSVEEIQFSDNGLTSTVNFSCFKSSLVRLSLTSQALEKVVELDSLVQLEVLNLSHNKLKTLESSPLLSRLRSLNLKDNEMTSIACLGHFASLEDLDIQGNKIAKLDGIVGLSNLRRLNTSGNPLAHITDLLRISLLNKLVELTLSDSHYKDSAVCSHGDYAVYVKIIFAKILVFNGKPVEKEAERCLIEILSAIMQENIHSKLFSKIVERKLIRHAELTRAKGDETGAVLAMHSSSSQASFSSFVQSSSQNLAVGGGIRAKENSVALSGLGSAAGMSVILEQNLEGLSESEDADPNISGSGVDDAPGGGSAKKEKEHEHEKDGETAVVLKVLKNLLKLDGILKSELAALGDINHMEVVYSRSIDSVSRIFADIYTAWHKILLSEFQDSKSIDKIQSHFEFLLGLPPVNDMPSREFLFARLSCHLLIKTIMQDCPNSTVQSLAESILADRSIHDMLVTLFVDPKAWSGHLDELDMLGLTVETWPSADEEMNALLGMPYNEPDKWDVLLLTKQFADFQLRSPAYILLIKLLSEQCRAHVDVESNQRKILWITKVVSEKLQRFTPSMHIVAIMIKEVHFISAMFAEQFEFKTLSSLRNLKDDLERMTTVRNRSVVEDIEARKVLLNEGPGTEEDGSSSVKKAPPVVLPHDETEQLCGIGTIMTSSEAKIRSKQDESTSRRKNKNRTDRSKFGGNKESNPSGRPLSSIYVRQSFAHTMDRNLILCRIENIWLQVDPFVNRIYRGALARSENLPSEDMLFSNCAGSLQISPSRITWKTSSSEQSGLEGELQKLSSLSEYGTFDASLMVENVVAFTYGVVPVHNAYFLGIATDDDFLSFFPFYDGEIHEVSACLTDITELDPEEEDTYVIRMKMKKIEIRREQILVELHNEGEPWLSDTVSLQHLLNKLLRSNRKPLNMYDLELLYHSCRLNDSVCKETFRRLTQLWGNTDSDVLRLKLLEVVERLTVGGYFYTMGDKPFGDFWEWLEQIEADVELLKSRDAYTCFENIKHQGSIAKQLLLGIQDPEMEFDYLDAWDVYLHPNK